MSTVRYGPLVGVLLQGGRVLVTGPSGDSAEMGNVDIYDPVGGWSPGRKLTSPRVGEVAASLPGGRALFAGGFPEIGGAGGPGRHPLPPAGAQTTPPPPRPHDPPQNRPPPPRAGAAAPSRLAPLVCGGRTA